MVGAFLSRRGIPASVLTLSERRRLEVARALVLDLKIVLVLVEQNVSEALEISDRAYVLDHGRIARSGPAALLRDDQEIGETYMGL